jgi:hypothetical protein
VINVKVGVEIPIIIQILIFQAFSGQIRLYFKAMNKRLLGFFIISATFLSLVTLSHSESESEDEDDTVVATEEVSIHPQIPFSQTHVGSGGIAVNTLNKLSQPTRSGPLVWYVGVGLTAPCYKTAYYEIFLQCIRL